MKIDTYSSYLLLSSDFTKGRRSTQQPTEIYGFSSCKLKQEDVSEGLGLQCGHSRFLAPIPFHLYLFVSTGRQSTTTPRSCILETLRRESAMLLEVGAHASTDI